MELLQVEPGESMERGGDERPIGCGEARLVDLTLQDAELMVGGLVSLADNGGVMRPAALPVEPGTFSLATPPLFAALAPARSVLIAGAGGGFDVYAGLPLALALWHRGARVHLANLSFSELELIDRDSWATEHVAA